MKYISTRGGIAPISFKEAVLMGLATDGGLLLPEKMPEVTGETAARWQTMRYQELAFEVMSLFIDDIADSDLRTLIAASYAAFNHKEITPVVQKQKNLYILELFHGPTLAFKDVALQFLGNVFEFLLRESGDRMNILGATSGDTGSAAIYGVRGKERIHIFILHPHKRVSRIQELQMTTVTDANVFNIAVQGTFDDGQAIVKEIFNDISFKEKHHLGAVNSINWARILAQVVYYLYAFFRVRETNGAGRVDFSVPTGNFGDIFAGYIAKRLLPANIYNLILATNENDLLTRFVNNGDYSLGKVVPTYSPSMDIQVASNFERYLYFLYDRDQSRVRQAMADFAGSGKLGFSTEEHARVQEDFTARCVSEEETLTTIRTFFEETGYILDPHTAVGVGAAQSQTSNDLPVICLATAHPAKFGDAVKKAIGREPELPPEFSDLAERPSRCEILPADTGEVKKYIDRHAI